MNWVSPSTFFAESHEVGTSSSRQTHSITVCTSGGGLAKDLISLMSFFESALSAPTAAFIAGIAASRSACASSAITFTSAAVLDTCCSSMATVALILSASAFSLVTVTMVLSVSC